MRSILITIRFLIIFILGSIAAQAQDIDSLLVRQREADPQEKVYVHFDKNFYNPGETIWFKAYLFSGLERSLTSRNFYAELRDEAGRLLDKKTTPIIMSGAASHFELDSLLGKSTVYFRAYTTTMLNGDTSFLYVKPIRIIIPPKKTTAKPGAASTAKTSVGSNATMASTFATEIKFLPEGGDLVEGLHSNVAFKATGFNGVPVAITGQIKDQSGNKVADITTLHDGMGVFQLTPEAGHSYTATWKDANKKEYTTPLPAVKATGIILQVSNTAEGKRFSVQRQPDAADNLKNLTVLAIMNQQLVYQAKINLSAKAAVAATLPTEDLASGILQITVLDKDLRPVAERICFVNNSNYEFDADAWLSEINTAKRGLNRAEVKIGDTVTANLSLAITDADLDMPPSPFEDNIVTRLLLTGDLRGKVNKPYYYFYSTADSAAIHLDLVMLSNGWRRYNWDNLLAGKFPVPKYKENNYLGISGQLISMGGNFPEGLQLSGIMQTTDSNKTFLALPVDRKGFVHSDGFIFYDSAKLYLNFNDKNKDFDPSMFNVGNGLLDGDNPTGLAMGLKQAAIEVDSLLAARNIRKNSEELKLAAKRWKDAHELGNVVVKGTAKTNVDKMDERYTSGLFRGGDSKQFDVANDPLAASSFSVFQYLQGRVAGLQITTGANGTQMSWRGGTPTLYLDEIRSDVQMLSSLSMSNVAYIKVFNPGSTGAISNSGGGVISVYTRRGEDMTSSAESRLGMLRLNGYSAIKQFYAPDYASPSGEDYYDNLGTTLYWEPFIVLDKTKKRFKIQFYNNDITKRFRIVLEGIDESGRLVHVEKVVEK